MDEMHTELVLLAAEALALAIGQRITQGVDATYAVIEVRNARERLAAARTMVSLHER